MVTLSEEGNESQSETVLKSEADVNSGSAQSRPRRPWWARLLILFGVFYVGVLVLLLIFESWLIFPGILFPLDPSWENTSFEYEEVEFESKDGTALVGWYLPREGAKRNLLLCHGNAEDVAKTSNRMGNQFRLTLDANVFVFDYRGYGKSQGSPSEAKVLEDAEAAMQWLNEKTGTRPDEVIVLGHSLGGGPACHVASSMGAKILVLQRTFSSVADVAADRYWFLPVRGMMRNKFESAKRLENCKVPVFQSHGTADRVVPYKFGRKLHAASAAERKAFFVFEGGNHFTKYTEEYLARLTAFVERIESDGLIKNKN